MKKVNSSRLSAAIEISVPSPLSLPFLGYVNRWFYLKELTDFHPGQMLLAMILIMCYPGMAYAQAQPSWDYPPQLVLNNHYENMGRNAGGKEGNVKDYFSNYPDKPGFEQQQEWTSASLSNQDYTYLLLGIAGILGPQGEYNDKFIKESWDLMYGGQLAEFKQWVHAVERLLPMAYLFVDPEILRQTKKEYDVFAAKRDRAIYNYYLEDIKPSSSEAYLQTVIAIDHPAWSRQEVESHYSEMGTSYGQHELLEASDKVRTAEKNNLGKVKSPYSLGPLNDESLYGSVLNALANSSIDFYLQIVLDKDYEAWLERYAKDSLIYAAKELWTFPHTGNGPYYLNRKAERYNELEKKYGYYSYNYGKELMTFNFRKQEAKALIQYICRRDPSTFYSGFISLDANDPYKFAMALIKRQHPEWEYDAIMNMVNRQEFFLREYDGSTRKEAMLAIQQAPKNPNYSLQDPGALGVNTPDPLEAFKQYLQAHLSPESMYKAMYKEANGTLNNAEDYYSDMVFAFGREHVDKVTLRIYEAQKKGEDPLSMEGAVSGFSSWEDVYGDVLFATAPIENCIDGIFRMKYGYRGDKQKAKLYEQYEEKNIMMMAQKVALAPKSNGDRGLRMTLPISIEDPELLGLDAYSNSQETALNGLLYQQKRELLKNPPPPKKLTKAEISELSEGAFYIGQKLKVKVGGKWRKGEVIEEKNGKYRVRFEYGSGVGGTKWGSPEELSKITK